MAAAKILILGGYGMFGGRLVRLLADEEALTILVAGRSAERATSFCRGVAARARLVPCAFDREGNVETRLQTLHPDLVIDASGPFQAYSYGVVRAALKHGIHYIDLADASSFVSGISEFDEEARRQGVFVLSGASTLPLLTVAAARRMSHELVRLDRITAGIAPSPYAGLGANVIAAIASYAGKPIQGSDRRGIYYGLIDSIHYTIRPPGELPLGRRRFSVIDAPELQLMPELWPSLSSIWIGVGTVPIFMHRLLTAAAWLVRLGILHSLLPLTRVLHWAANTLRWGEHRGGMFVELEGLAESGKFRASSWHMIAEGDDGPFIPAMPAAMLVRKWLSGAGPAPGARNACHELELPDYESMFAARTIRSGVRRHPPADAPLYQRVLADAFNRLPDPVRELHNLTSTKTWSGRASVTRGAGILAMIAGKLLGFPEATADVPVTVEFRREGDRELWTRRFGGKSFKSTQEEGTGADEGLIVERFGPLSVACAILVDQRGISLAIRGWTLMGFRMPLSWGPRCKASETADGRRFRFDVKMWHPLTGFIVHYRGWLSPDEPVGSV
jgi:hypothetical protein